MTSPNSMDVFKTFHLMTITHRHSMLLVSFAPMSTLGWSRIRAMLLLFTARQARWSCHLFMTSLRNSFRRHCFRPFSPLTLWYSLLIFGICNELLHLWLHCMQAFQIFVNHVNHCLRCFCWLYVIFSPVCSNSVINMTITVSKSFILLGYVSLAAGLDNHTQTSFHKKSYQKVT